jgi:hypothetical protein
MTSPQQCRTARALLSRSAAELAKHAHVATRTIFRHELDEAEVAPESLMRMMRAMEDRGVQFRRDGWLRLVERKGASRE